MAEWQGEAGRGLGVCVEPGILRVPGWERLPWLRAGFSTRQGGGSSVYGDAEQNLGWTSDDDPRIVAANRAAFVRAVAEGSPMELVTVHQIHGAVVHDLERESPPFMTPEGKARMKGDGLVNATPGRLLAILTADCVPVLLADARTHAVGAVHAGWRGTLARIVERGIDSMQRAYGSRPEDMVAAIGPCVGACCYSVGEEVRSGFEGEFGYAEALFSERAEFDGGSALTTYLDLVEANRRQLLDAGVPAENINVIAECTACTRLPDGLRKYFSHRDERGFTGRMLSGIGAVA